MARMYSAYKSVIANRHKVLYEDSQFIGSPFTYPTGRLPVANAQSLRILAHDLTVVFETPFTRNDWHNFAVQVDWDALTLGVYYSKNWSPLAPTSRKTVPDTGAVAGPDGQGDFHFGVLKVSSNYILLL